MSQIAIINQSAFLSNSDSAAIVNAMNMVLPQFCSDWSISLVKCIYIPKGIKTYIPIQICLTDSVNPNTTTLAYHSMSGGISYGIVNVKTILTNNGSILYNPQHPNYPSVAQAVCHEIFEMLIDPWCNTWSSSNYGNILFAYEVCDPVQSNMVLVKVPTTNSNGSQTLIDVKLSDWVLPRWFNPQAQGGSFNHANTLKAPFSVDKSGYAIKNQNNVSSIVYGETITPEMEEMISNKIRVSKRINE
jgi:hypothetical protein